MQSDQLGAEASREPGVSVVGCLAWDQPMTCVCVCVEMSRGATALMKAELHLLMEEVQTTGSNKVFQSICFVSVSSVSRMKQRKGKKSCPSWWTHASFDAQSVRIAGNFDSICGFYSPPLDCELIDFKCERTNAMQLQRGTSGRMRYIRIVVLAD